MCAYLTKAIDLGLNRNSDNWKIHGEDLFNAEETQTRRQIWWVCVLADRLVYVSDRLITDCLIQFFRYGSIYMGKNQRSRSDSS